MIKRITLISCFLLHCLLLMAQQAKPYYFAHYGVNNGLAAYNATSIVQDERGFIWIGTMNGLQRLDGNRFLSFRHVPGADSSIPDNNVEQLLFDRSNRLWLVMNDGSVGSFDTRRFTFRKAKVTLSKQNNLQSLRKLSEDSQGNLYFTFFNTEILTYNGRRNEFSAGFNPFPLPLNWKPVAITDDPVTKKYYIGTDSGMAVFNPANRRLSYAGHNADDEPLIAKWPSVMGVGMYKVDSRRRLWFLSWPVNAGASRLYCYDLLKKEAVLDAYDLVPVAKQYIEPDYFLEQRDGSIWISGLKIWAKFIERERRFESVYEDFNSNDINFDRLNMFEDREHNLWLATSNNGIHVFNPGRKLFNSVKHLNRLRNIKGTGYVINFLREPDGSTLVAVWGDGLFRYDSNFNNIPLNIEGIEEANGYSVWSLCRSRNGRTTWLAGQQGFIFIYDALTRKAKRYDPPIFEGKTIRQVIEDRDGTIWLGTQSRGLYKWDPARGRDNFEAGFSRFKTIPNVRIKHMILDSKGYLWVCTNKEGVYQVDPGNDKVIQQIHTKSSSDKKLLTNDASAIAEYNDSTMIIATGGVNIYNTKANTIEHISAADGLPADAVVSIEKDREGFLWFGLMNGLCRMNYEKRRFTFFDRSDGIANDNFQVAASYTLPDGRMLFGSTDDFVVFNPADLKTGEGTPDVLITEFKVLNRSLLVDSISQLKRIELKANQNSITIGFAALSYFNRNKLSYYYMLEGIDKEWKQANELNQAIYNYLPPGSYTFRVKAENADGVPGKNLTTLRVKVDPPFWKSWWFLTLSVVVTGLLFYWFDRFQLKKKEDFQRIRSDVADNLHREVNIALNNINILSEMAKIKADQDPGKSKEYIEQIHSKSHNMIIAMDDMLWSLSPKNDSMQKTVERMREFIDALKNRHAAYIEISVDKKVGALELNMKFRHEAFILFKEAIYALVKAGTKRCLIHIGFGKANLIFTMQFENAGCDMQELNSLLQRHDLQNLMDSIQASLNVQVHKTNSVFVLELPVKK